MKTIFSKIMLAVLTLSLLMAGLPLSSVHAAGLDQTSTPPATLKLGTPRLERAFARETKIVNKAGKLYEQFDKGFPKLQKRLDKAKEKGKDVSAAQTALDAVKKALTDARPLYNQAKSLVDAHTGFDASGKVTDPAAALETVKSLRDAGKQFKTAMGGTIKTLHEALKALRGAK